MKTTKNRPRTTTILMAVAILMLASVSITGAQNAPPAPDRPHMDGSGPHGPHGPGQRGGPGMRGGQNRGDMLMRALHRLDLSDDQKDTLKALRESNKDAVQANREQVRNAKKALREEMQAELVNLDAVRSLAGDVGAVGVELAVFRAAMKNQMMEILTKEQRAELQEMARKRQERVEQWKAEGGPRSKGRRGGHRQR